MSTEINREPHQVRTFSARFHKVLAHTALRPKPESAPTLARLRAYGQGAVAQLVDAIATATNRRAVCAGHSNAARLRRFGLRLSLPLTPSPRPQAPGPRPQMLSYADYADSIHVISRPLALLTSTLSQVRSRGRA